MSSPVDSISLFSAYLCSQFSPDSLCSLFCLLIFFYLYFCFLSYFFFLSFLSDYLLTYVNILMPSKVKKSGSKIGPTRISGGTTFEDHNRKLHNNPSRIGVLAVSNICKLNANLNTTHNFLHFKKLLPCYLLKRRFRGKQSKTKNFPRI